MPTPRPRPRQAGFTVVEFLVAVAVIGLIMSGLLDLLMTGQTSFLQGSSRASAVQSGRGALARMMDEIRGAGFNPAGATFPAITAPSPTGFTLQNDWNGDGVIDPAITVTVGNPALGEQVTQRGEQVTYSVVGNELRRQESNIDATPQTIAPVGTATFQYLDRFDVVTAVDLDIRTIVVVLDSQPQSQGATTLQGQALISMTDRARLRNR